MKSMRALSAQCRSSKTKMVAPAPPAARRRPPGAEQVLLVAGRTCLKAQKLRQAGLDEASLLGVVDVLTQRRSKLAQRDSTVLLFEDAGPAAHHLRQRPERDPVAVCHTSAPMPPRVGSQAVDVLLEFPRQPRLPDAANARHGHEMGSPFGRRRMEQVLDQARLRVATGERRLDLVGPHAASDQADDASGSPQLDRLGLSLELVDTGILVDDRGLGGMPGRFPDKDRPNWRSRLDPGRGVHEIAGHHPLSARAHGDRCLPGQDPGTGAQICDPNLFPQCGDGGREVEGRADRPLGVVLVGGGRAPDCHDGIADELLDRSAIALDELAAGLKVTRQQVSNLLSIPALAHAGEPDQVGEQDRNHAPFGGGTDVTRSER